MCVCVCVTVCERKCVVSTKVHNYIRIKNMHGWLGRKVDRMEIGQTEDKEGKKATVYTYTVYTHSLLHTPA